MNWGYKLLFSFLVFGAGMFFLVYRTMTTEFELVEKNYYQSELKYQDLIDASKRTVALNQPVVFLQNEQEVIITFPTTPNSGKITGNILFYCAYNGKNDRQFPLNLVSVNKLSIRKDKLIPGKYTVKLNWNDNFETYYTEQTLTIY